jgi:hypothetical protein
VFDIIDRMEENNMYVPADDLVSDKLGDVINYMLLLEGLIVDRKELIQSMEADND